MVQPKKRSKWVLWIGLVVVFALSILCIFVILWNETGIFGNDSIYKPLSDCPVPPAAVAEDSKWSEVVTDSSWEKMGLWYFQQMLQGIVIDSKDRIYVATFFVEVSGTQVGGIARWDPQAQTWNDLGGGLLSVFDEATIEQVEIDNQDRIYIAGSFNQAGIQIVNGIAMWDGQFWHAFGNGLMNGSVKDMALLGEGKLYAAGTFSQVDRQIATRIAFWNGQVWQDPGGMSQKLADLLGVAPREVSAIAYDPAQKALYASGKYDEGDYERGFMAVWKENSQAWTLIADSPHFSPPTRMKMTPQGSLVAGGSTSFTVDAGGALSYGGTGLPAASYGMALFDNNEWRGLKSGLTLMGGSKSYQHAHGYSPVDPVYVTEMAFDKAGQLYIVGRFISVDNKCMYGIARWDGREWSALGSGLGPPNSFGPARDLAFDSRGNLYVVGNFQTAGGKPIRYLARWTP